jgi:hypothetical protein
MKTVRLLLVMALSAGVTFGQSSLATLLNNKATRKQAIFLSSGTFTPSANLLALGGWVDVIAVGGGGGGGNGDGTDAGIGGGGGKVVHLMAQIPGAVTVTIGAGGAAHTVGGTTTFGSYITASGGVAGVMASTSTSTFQIVPGGPGSNGAGSSPFASNGGHSGNGGPCLLGYGGGGGSGVGTNIYQGAGRGSCGAGNAGNWNTTGTAAAANTGGGGGGGGASSSTTETGGAGGSGIIIVNWFE